MDDVGEIVLRYIGFFRFSESKHFKDCTFELWKKRRTAQPVTFFPSNIHLQEVDIYLRKVRFIARIVYLTIIP